MRQLEKFYKDADAILKRMNHDDAVMIIQLAGNLCTEAREYGYDRLKRMNHDDAILLIQLAGNLCTDARIYGYDSGREHEIEMNRIRNI